MATPLSGPNNNAPMRTGKLSKVIFIPCVEIARKARVAQIAARTEFSVICFVFVFIKKTPFMAMPQKKNLKWQRMRNWHRRNKFLSFADNSHPATLNAPNPTLTLSLLN